jgi:hypothetical protein
MKSLLVFMLYLCMHVFACLCLCFYEVFFGVYYICACMCLHVYGYVFMKLYEVFVGVYVIPVHACVCMSMSMFL